MKRVCANCRFLITGGIGFYCSINGYNEDEDCLDCSNEESVIIDPENNRCSKWESCEDE